MKRYDQFYIDGEWVAPINPRPFELINPATEIPYATVSLGDSADVDRAVASARRAFPSFSSSSKEERIGLLERITTVYTARAGEIMTVLKEEMGAPRNLTAHTAAGLAALKQTTATLKDYTFETRLGADLVRREPIGVAGLITPWNWPNQMICNKLTSALVAGCPVVLKPSEFTPGSAIVLADILHQADIPRGVFNLVNGDGPMVGAAISAHEGIDIVSFTGSTRAGILVAGAAAPSVKRVTQELGGKSADIVLHDADLKAAAEFNVARGFSNAGQSCHAPTRLLVHESQRDEMLDYLRNAVARIRLGDPNDPATTMGPVVNRAQFERIQHYIRTGLDEGATAMCGGLGRPEGLDRGFYVRPTIFADVKPEMRIAREEIFGPVTVVMTYKNDAEAIEIANGTSYGLGAYVFGLNREKAMNMAGQLRAGRVFLNGAPSNTAAPMGG